MRKFTEIDKISKASENYFSLAPQFASLIKRVEEIGAARPNKKDPVGNV